MLSVKDLSNGFSYTLTLNFSGVFFLISTILTLKYNFDTKQIFVGLYISFLKQKW